MKKIAMVNCLKANDVCTGAGCMHAFYERTGGFAEYGDEPLQLMAFMRCSHCIDEMDPLTDEGFLEKLERLVKIGTEVIHIGVCATKEQHTVHCPGMQKMADAFEEKGIKVVWKTH